MTEEDLEKIIRKVISEQTGSGITNTKTIIQDKEKIDPNFLPCVPTAFKLAIDSLIKKGYNKTFLKVSLGIIGRESDFGESKRYLFTAPLKRLLSIFGGNTSVGYGQIKPETVAKFGLSTDDLSMTFGSLIGAYKILNENYNKAIQVGYTTQSSTNFKEGTGNSALDLAIATYNLGPSKITKYCKTDKPNIARPCWMSNIKVEDGPTVTNQVIQNYIPNFKTKRWDNVDISSHGYIKEVAERMKTYNCF